MEGVAVVRMKIVRNLGTASTKRIAPRTGDDTCANGHCSSKRRSRLDVSVVAAVVVAAAMRIASGCWLGSSAKVQPNQATVACWN